VVTSWPSAIAASTVQLLTGSPSSSTQQAPVGGVAAPVGAREAKRVAEEVHEQGAGLSLSPGRLAVDGQVDLHGKSVS
jgi:hypothetical protein